MNFPRASARGTSLTASSGVKSLEAENFFAFILGLASEAFCEVR